MIINIIKTILYFIVFLYSLIIFLPKENLYFYIVNKLNQKSISLKVSQIDGKFLHLYLNQLNIKYDTMNIAQISKIKFKSYIFYNELSIKNIIINNSMQTFVPQTILSIKTTHNILDPFFLYLDIKSKTAQAKGTIDLINKTINLTVNISKKFQRDYPMILKILQFKQNTKQGGIYTYEYNF